MYHKIYSSLYTQYIEKNKFLTIFRDEIPQLWLPSHGKTNDPDPCSEYWIGPVRTSFLAISLHHSGPLDLPPGGASTREEVWVAC